MPLTGMYVLQGINPAAVAAAPFDVKVIDLYDDNGVAFTPAQVQEMGGGPGGGLLLGYFSIGEAENYRSYFSTMDPSILGPVDPDWPGDYQVAYWTPQWKAIATAYIDSMIKAGYDGAYFDVVDEYQTAWAQQNAPGGDAEGAMVSLISYLAAYARAQDPGFQIWTNNAEELLANPTYLATIDGMYKEELFYQDNGNPQPASETNASLSLIDKMLAVGKPVIAIEYVSGAAAIADVHAKAAAAGVGSYIAHLDLNGIDMDGVVAGQAVDPTISIVAASASKAEGNSGSTPFTFTVTRTGDTSGTSSATWKVTGSGTNPANAADFTGGVLPTGTVTFAAGVTTQTITVNVAGDTTVEPDEGFTVTLSAPSANTTIGTASATGTITNDDGTTTTATTATLSIAAASASKAEGNSGSTPFTFTVTRSGNTTIATSATWKVTGSGTSPANAADFTGGVLPTGTVTFAAGVTTQTITVNVAGDTTVEPNEGFTVTLSAPAANTTLGTASATGTITNDDGTTTATTATLSIAAASASKAEGNSGSTPFTFTVTRSGNTTIATSATWKVTGSGANPANARDFTGHTLPTGTVTFAAGVTKQTITVNVAGDTRVEPNEGFTVTLSAPAANTTLGTASATGTIMNDDTAAATVSASATLAASSMTFVAASGGTTTTAPVAGTTAATPAGTTSSTGLGGTVSATDFGFGPTSTPDWTDSTTPGSHGVLPGTGTVPPADMAAGHLTQGIASNNG